jgi:hypothetical protein
VGSVQCTDERDLSVIEMVMLDWEKSGGGTRGC